MTGDGRVVEVSGETTPERILWTLARVRYQARLKSSSITAVVIMVKRSDDEPAAMLPDNEDVGVFVCGIVFLLQASSEAAVGNGPSLRSLFSL